MHIYNRETLEAQLDLLGFVDTNAMAEEVYATLEGRQIKKEEPPKEEPAVDPDAVDMAAFTKNLQPILDDTEQYKGYNVYRKLAIKNILREAGVDVGEASDPLGLADVLKDAYAPEKLSREAPQQMRDVTKSLFVSTYNALTQKGINPKNKIEITQKLTNEFIEHFSPAFFNENLLKYANNYVINDKAIFRECLTTLKFPEKEIKAMVDDQIDGTRLHNNAQLFMGMPSLNARTNSNISDILKAADVGADKINALEINEILTDAYALNKIPNASIPMRDVAKNVFISTYDAMTKKGVVTKNKVDTAQKIADELLKNYSPVAYTDKKLNEYANNYVLSDKDLLRECLTTLKVPEKEINAIVGIAPEKKQENTAKKAPVNDTANVAVFMSKLNDFNKMYKLNINADNFASSVTDAWVLLKKSDNQSQSYGRKMMKDLFKDTLKQAFALERDTSYNEHRLPDYNEIIKSSNDLLRSAMYAFTDLYHDPKSASWFDKTAFGCLSASEMADQTTGKSLWDMDQKSDEAWEIQSKEAKDITEKWKKEANPYEKMIKEMNDLVANAKKNGNYDRREVGLKLAAAEWLLTNDSRMMIEDPEDPINPIPNWGNRYWKTLIQTRDALGIDKHTSMRDQIQQDYAAAAKSVRSYAYHERQISDHITDPKERAKFDSIDKQKEQFATQSAHVTLTEDNKKKSDDEIVMTSDRVQISVKSLDQRLLMKKELKSYHFVSERTAELTIESQNKGAQM